MVNREILRSAIRDMSYERSIALGLLELEEHESGAFAGYKQRDCTTIEGMHFVAHPRFFLEWKVRMIFGSVQM